MLKKKALLILALGIWAVLITGCNEKNTAGGDTATTGVKFITVNQLKTELDAGLDENTIIVDLREPILFEKGHIKGAVLVPFADFEKKYSQLDKDKRIILVCHMGPMGEAAGQFLSENGYKQVYNVKGGMRAWEG